MQDKERIRRRAYDLWEQAGRPEGREAEHWEQACREIEAEGGNPPTGSGGADQTTDGLGQATDDLPKT